MTKQHFEAAARQVRAIRDGHWTHELPDWAQSAFGVRIGYPIETDTADTGNLNTSLVRAAWTAEAYVLLFSEFNPRFDRKRFLKACGF